MAQVNRVNGRIVRGEPQPLVEHVATLVSCTVFCRNRGAAQELRQLTLGIDSEYQVGKPRSAIYLAQYINEKAIEEVLQDAEIANAYGDNPEDFFTVVNRVFKL